MSKTMIDPVKLIEQMMPQLLEEDEAKITVPASPDLQLRINDVITFDDASELRIQVMAPRGSGDDLATEAYYGLLAAISNIQANTNLTHGE